MFFKKMFFKITYVWAMKIRAVRENIFGEQNIIF